jgi:GDP-L-fucose synthase
MKNKILVTGSNGLVGSEINADYKIGKEYDLRKDFDCSRMLSMYEPTHVVNCAAKVGGIGLNMSKKGELFYDNIMINTNMIENCRKYNVKKLVTFLSTCIFPDNINYPLTEKKIHLGSPHFSNDAYAYAKRMVDIQNRAYREQYGIEYVSVIPTNIYGPNDNYSLENGHLIPMLIHKMYLASKYKQDFVVWGSGKPMREFIYSKDIAKLTEWVLLNYNDDEPIILGNSLEVSIIDIVDLIIKEFNFKGNVKFDKSKPDGQLRKPSDNTKLMTLIPDFVFTPLELGLKETINHFIQNYESIRK